MERWFRLARLLSLVALLLFSSFLGLKACLPEAPKCSKDEQCQKEELCLGVVCQKFTCSSNPPPMPCPKGLACNSGLCRRPCKGNNECPADRPRCAPTGICVDPNAEIPPDGPPDSTPDASPEASPDAESGTPEASTDAESGTPEASPE